MTGSEFKRLSSAVSLSSGIIVGGGLAYVAPTERIEALLLGVGLWLFLGASAWVAYVSARSSGGFQNRDGSWPSEDDAAKARSASTKAPLIHFLWPFAKHTE